MVQKCPSCNTTIVKWAIKGQPEKTLLENFKERTIIWKNLFKMEFKDIMLIIALVCIIYGYVTDTAICKEISEYPCGWYNESGCCEYLQMESQYNRQPIPQDELEFRFNLSNG